jgi:adenylate cyclase
MAKISILRMTLAGHAVLLVLVVAFMMDHVFERISWNVYDFDMRRTMDRTPHEAVIVVAIDEDSLKEYGQFPWERDAFVPFLDHVSRAKAVMFDIMFNTDGKDKESDRRFTEALARHDNVILASSLVTETAVSGTLRGRAGELLPVHGVNLPIAEFADKAAIGHIFRHADEDGVTRRVHLAVRTPDETVYSVAWLAAERYGADAESFLRLTGKTKQIGASPRGEMLIRFNALEEDFMTVPFHLVDETDPSFFEDAIVLVGVTAAGEDTGATAVDKSMTLVYAHANIIDQMLKGEKVFLAPTGLILACAILLAGLTALSVWRWKTIWAVVWLTGMTVVLFAGQYGLFAATGVFADPVYPLFSLYLSFLLNMSVKTFHESKQRSHITKQFGRYISPELVKQIAASGKEIELGGINKELTILFLDVRGFTTLSEKLEPEEVVGFLNMMFDLITEKALNNRGTIDKFIGDAAMILFNAPLDVPDHPYRAVKTAYDIQKGMEAVRKRILDTYGVVISVGIGIHTGEAVVGNIGSYLRVDYTAIGDNVNTAARIESQTTANQVLVSEETYERTKAWFRYRFFDERLMKGKTVPVKLYELEEHIGEPGDESGLVVRTG